MFQAVDPKKTLPQVEKDQIAYWQEQKIFESSVDQRKGNDKFVFFDGPPFANGLPHYGHILAGALKDAVVRYKNMQGYYVPRVNGWDCHGLPVEYEIEKTLDISGHKDIVDMGINKFNSACRESVFKYTEQWEELIVRIGRWIDFEKGYATLQNSYMESIWWVFNQIWQKDMVYLGRKSMHICPRCETPLSNFEVTQGYKDVTDYSITAKFELEDEPGTFVLAWTTTPWTLPANQALAFGPKIKYIRVEHEGAKYVVAEDMISKIFGEDAEVKKLDEFKPKDWEGKKYKPLFPYYLESHKTSFIITLADFVTTEDGTGIVHIAGGFGEDDYNTALKYDLEPITHIGMDGHFNEEVTEFVGKFVKGQEQNIGKYLEDKGLLFEGENYRHSYPHCWRCDTPLLNYTLGAWFIEVTKIQDKLLKNNKKIAWQPPHIKEGRFGKWLENARDWNVSRNRFWGCPIPIWQSESGNFKCISSINELRKLSKDGNNVFFVRHGQADHNVEGILSGDPHTKRNLTEKGKEQVIEAASQLKDKNITVIYSSPFNRTLQTAELIKQELGVEIEIITDERIRERNMGNLEGKSHDEKKLELSQSEKIYTHKFGETGESYRDIEERMIEFINYISHKHSNENILVVTHGGPIIMTKKYLEDLQPNQELLFQSSSTPHQEVHQYYLGKIPTNEQGEIDLHRPYIDDIVITDPETGEDMHRVPEVFDCWFESGSMPYAQLHYPFENKEDFEKNFPADFIAEGLDQTRGWFYTLHVIATILFDEPAFQNVIVNGILLAKNGEKLSKSKKNYPDPNELFDTKGVDSTRLFLYQSTAPLAEDVRFSDDHVDEIVKKFTLTLWNTYSFFVTYANIDNFDPQATKLELNKLHELDRWLLSELHQLTAEVTKHMDEYNLSKATRPLIQFVDNLSNWYIRRSRRRFWKSENDQDKMLAYKTLHTVLTEICKLIAPFTPFIADEVYRNLTSLASVHLEDWPKADSKLIDQKLNDKMRIARTIVRLGHSIRAKENLKVRQPLAKIQVAVPNKQDAKYLQELQDVVLEELNVKEIELIQNPEDQVQQSLKPNSKTLGPKLGQSMKDVLNAAREGKYEIKENKVKIANQELDLEDFEVEFKAIEGFSAEADEGMVVILDTQITTELRHEGLVREIVRYIQDFRKELDYNVSDRIYIYLKTDNQELEQAITHHADYIKTETLGNELQQSGDFEWDQEKIVEIEEFKLTIALRKAND